MTDTRIALSDVPEFVKKELGLPKAPHSNTVRRWIKFGTRGRKLQAVLVAGRWFCAEKDVIAFLGEPANTINTAGGRTILD